VASTFTSRQRIDRADRFARPVTSRPFFRARRAPARRRTIVARFVLGNHSMLHQKIALDARWALDRASLSAVPLPAR
jgi:hypothetical protein